MKYVAHLVLLRVLSTDTIRLPRSQHRRVLSPHIVQPIQILQSYPLVICKKMTSEESCLKKTGATHTISSFLQDELEKNSESLITYGLKITNSSDIPFLKTLYPAFIVYYLGAKEVVITNRVCLALLKAFQIGQSLVGH